MHLPLVCPLPLGGKKRKLSRKVWIDYFLRDRLGMRTRDIDRLLGEFEAAMSDWTAMICRSFLSEPLRQDYLVLLNARMNRLSLSPACRWTRFLQCIMENRFCLHADP